MAFVRFEWSMGCCARAAPRYRKHFEASGAATFAPLSSQAQWLLNGIDRPAKPKPRVVGRWVPSVLVRALMPRCHFPTNPVRHPRGANASLRSTSSSATPAASSGTSTRSPAPGGGIMPIRAGRRPVSAAARDGVQTDSAAYHWRKRSPPAANLSMCPTSCVGCP